MIPGGGRGRRNDASVGRRRLLAAAGSGVAAALAGCLGLRSRSFEASPVVLPSADQRSLRLGETLREPTTVERSVAGVDVSITSRTAVYSRAVGLGGE